MIYDLSGDIDKQRATERFNALLNAHKVIELKEKRKRRTINANRYIHVLFSLFGIEFGYSLEESKTLLKRECPFMRYEKSGQAFLKRTSDMDTKELSEFIDWIRNYSSIQGLYLLTSQEYIENSHHIDQQIDSHKRYL